MTRSLQRIFDNLLSRRRIKQAVMAVESMDESFRWSRAGGIADEHDRPVTIETPFFLASIDKLLNATVAMKLSESGLVELDESIATYLPGTLIKGLHRFEGVDHTDKITLRHLLGHTSGLADWLEDAPKGGVSLIERIIHDGDLSLDVENIASILRDQLTPHFPPQDLSAQRQRARYCDTNYILLFAIIEAVTGEPLHHVHDRLIFRPLGLRHTYFPGFSQPNDPTPDALTLRVEGRPLPLPLLLQSIRGIYGTLADCLAFLRGLICGELFTDESTAVAMQEPWKRFGFPLDRAALRAPGWPIEYGLGIMRFRLPRLFTPFHPIPPVLGHTGSTGCWLFYCPEFDVLLAGSVDEVTASAVPYRIVPKLIQSLRGPLLSGRLDR